MDSQSQQACAPRSVKMLKQQDQNKATLLAYVASLQAEKEAQHDVKEMSKCHQMFRTSDYEGHKARNPDRVRGACLWLLAHPEYLD